ncbi:MAG: hypothetical protein ACYTHK_10485 [Planctomycetota bacterium]
MRDYIPLFFLAPSLLLLVHAWNRTGPLPPRVFVEIDSGGFEFPRDIALELRWGEQYLPVRGYRASFPAPAPGPVTCALFASRPGAERVPVGVPAQLEIGSADESTRKTLRVTPAECTTALRQLRAAR